MKSIPLEIPNIYLGHQVNTFYRWLHHTNIKDSPSLHALHHIRHDEEYDYLLRHAGTTGDKHPG